MRKPLLLSVPILFFILITDTFSLRAEGAPTRTPSGPATFSIKLEKDDVLIVDKHQDIQIRDGNGKQTREERNRILLHAVEKKADGTTMEGDFLTYSRTPRLTGDYRQDEDFHSRFIFYADGHYDVPANYVMPNLQGLPGFPKSPVSVGGTWKAKALETMKLGIQKLSIPFEAMYQYDGKGKYKDEKGVEHEAEKISFKYFYDHKPAFVPRGAPVARVTARSGDVMFFDLDQGIPVFDTQKILYTFYLTDGSTVEYEYVIDSYWQKKRHASEENKQQKVDEIKKDIKTDDIVVRTDPEGVILELDDILFKTNSYTLTPEARKTVDTIAGILKKYKGHEIRILGHTDSRGSDNYNQTLSENRAKTVASVLKTDYGMEADKLSYRGFGKSKPIADNSTASGRSRNRRVEILIVME